MNVELLAVEGRRGEGDEAFGFTLVLAAASEPGRVIRLPVTIDMLCNYRQVQQHVLHECGMLWRHWVIEGRMNAFHEAEHWTSLLAILLRPPNDPYPDPPGP